MHNQFMIKKVTEIVGTYRIRPKCQWSTVNGQSVNKP